VTPVVPAVVKALPVIPEIVWAAVNVLAAINEAALDSMLAKESFKWRRVRGSESADH
jgi:hypothetical protein